ncbi:hypothetical protein B566_EDAN009118 [Ephemera danica]|nr:hypothetical protein B566_EDAN009118 [Ephemera danica]
MMTVQLACQFARDAIEITSDLLPRYTAIRKEKNGGAWCPRTQINREVREFLEVQLPSEHLVTHTETQGRFGNGQGQEFAESYLIEYSYTVSYRITFQPYFTLMQSHSEYRIAWKERDSDTIQPPPPPLYPTCTLRMHDCYASIYCLPIFPGIIVSPGVSNPAEKRELSRVYCFLIPAAGTIARALVITGKWVELNAYFKE